MPVLTRRQTLAGIAATGGVVALGGGIGLLQDHRAALVRDILRRSVGDFRMADDHFAALLDDIDEPFAPSRLRLAFYRAATFTGPDEQLMGLAPARIAADFEQYERRVVTAFMTRTDYLAVDPTAQPVRFIGGSACVNPFARLA